jgi:uncharacterized damage-inducible protein DinB
MARPLPGDYQAYQQAYLDEIEGDDSLKILRDQLKTTAEFIESIPDEKGTHTYAEGKWTIKQVIEHMIDTERIMAYRALCIARGEKQSLPGFEQDDYVNASNSNNRKISNLLNEYKKVRESNITLFENFDENILSRRGVANGKPITVNAILFVIAGHEAHHLNILKAKYLK